MRFTQKKGRLTECLSAERSKAQLKWISMCYSLSKCSSFKIVMMWYKLFCSKQVILAHNLLGNHIFQHLVCLKLAIVEESQKRQNIHFVPKGIFFFLKQTVSRAARMTKWQENYRTVNTSIEYCQKIPGFPRLPVAFLIDSSETMVFFYGNH